MFNISAVSLTFLPPKPTKFNISPVGSIFFSNLQNLLLAGEMLNLVGFGEKKVSETAEMLNMLNFFGFLELTGKIAL